MQGSNKVYGIVIFGEGWGEGERKRKIKGGRGEITSFLFDGRENYHIPVSFKHFKYFSERKISNYANTSFPPPPPPRFFFTFRNYKIERFSLLLFFFFFFSHDSTFRKQRCFLQILPPFLANFRQLSHFSTFLASLLLSTYLLSSSNN